MMGSTAGRSAANDIIKMLRLMSDSDKLQEAIKAYSKAEEKHRAAEKAAKKAKDDLAAFNAEQLAGHKSHLDKLLADIHAKEKQAEGVAATIKAQAEKDAADIRKEAAQQAAQTKKAADDVLKVVNKTKSDQDARAFQLDEQRATLDARESELRAGEARLKQKVEELNSHLARMSS